MTATGFKDLSECCKVSHDKQLKFYVKNGKYHLAGLNHCHKPCCPNCLPVLLLRQQKLINQAIEYAKNNDLKVSMWTINLPKSNTSLMFMRSKLHFVISDFLRVSSRNSKIKPINKEMKEINIATGSIGYIYRNEIATNELRFNPHVQLLDFRKQFLTSEQEDQLTESLVEICKRNSVFVSKKQSFKVHDVIIDYKPLSFSKDQNSYNYLTKIDSNDAIKLSETNSKMYEELCKSQILLNRKGNKEKIKIPLIYWKPGLKKLMRIKEEKFSVTDEDLFAIPEVITNFMKFNKIEPKKLIEIVNTTESLEILQNENIFEMLSAS